MQYPPTSGGRVGGKSETSAEIRVVGFDTIIRDEALFQRFRQSLDCQPQMEVSMPGSSENLFQLLKSLTPSQLAELGRRIQRAQSADPDLTKTPLANVVLKIKVNDTNDVDAAAFSSAIWKATGKVFPLTKEEIDKLQASQPAILQWIRLSKQNAALFAADPIRALRISNVPIDKSLLEKLQNMNRSPFNSNMFAGVFIKSVVLEAETGEEQSK
jgi:hypothetical protein